MNVWKMIFGVVCLMGAFNVQTAHAQLIDATFTGDNNISYWNGSSWISEGNNWQTPETISLNINQTSNIVYFAVSNDYTTPGSGYDNGNPAGFLASFTVTNGTFAQTGTNTLLSNSSTFKILAVNPWITNPSVFPTIPLLSTINPTVNPISLSGWVDSTNYAANGTSIWGAVNGGPVNGIDPNAQWIWTANDTSWTYAGTDDYAFLEVDLGTNPLVTPEPPTFLLFVFAGAMILILSIRNRIKSERSGNVPFSIF